MRRKPQCPKCGSERITRIDRYDAMACRACNVWTERTCMRGSETECDSGYCTGRPETPKDCNWNDPNNTEYGT